MRNSKSLRLTSGLFFFLAQSGWASGPFQSTCADQEQTAEDTLRDLKACLEKAEVKKHKSSSNVCAKEDKAHQTAVADLKTCLTGPSPTP